MDAVPTRDVQSPYQRQVAGKRKNCKPFNVEAFAGWSARQPEGARVGWHEDHGLTQGGAMLQRVIVSESQL